MDERLLCEQMYEQLIENLRMYHPLADDSEMIRKAFEVACTAHAGQRRKSGEPFVIHPIAVATILAQLHLDKETIIAALLHDVVEDTELTQEDITREFGEEISFLVDGVTKLSKLSTDATKAEMKMESFRKLLLAAATDIRVIIIKLADRLHNMRTLQYQPEKKQIEIATETMELYSPIAQRLGISVLSTELEDLSFSYLYPEDYQSISEKLAQMPRDKKMDIILSEIYQKLTGMGFDFQMRYERKHLFSIYRKMVNRQKTLEELYDICAVKLVVGSVRECYVVLGVLHQMYNPVPNRFKDYIAIPKENMYQSLHTTLISTGGSRFEVQIKTREMDATARYGVLASWKYGEKSVDPKQISKSQAQKALWLKQILEWQQEITNNEEFLSLVKNDFDLFSESISCFTPKGDVKRLQKGSTVVDFAYAIRGDLGDRLMGAYVNSVRKTPDYVLQNGDSVEILLRTTDSGPQREWLEFVKTGNAKNRIKKYFREVEEIYGEMPEQKEQMPEEKGEVTVTLKVFVQGFGGFEKLAPIYAYLTEKGVTVTDFSYRQSERAVKVVLRIPGEAIGGIVEDVGALNSVDHVEMVFVA